MDPAILTVPRLEKIPGLVHGFGTRRFGPAELRRVAAGHRAGVALLEQIHSDIVRVIKRPPSGKLTGDALATGTPGLFLAVKTADCLPILIADVKGRAVAAVHAGWRGTALGIAGWAALTLVHEFGLNPAGLVAALGPSVGASCCEVGEDVRRRFTDEDSGEEFFRPRTGRPGKYLFDLAAANAAHLEAAGVRRANIIRDGRCTHCRPEFHSFRRDRDPRRRLYNFIGLVQGPGPVA
ncbi:MAG: peptidoglycan editing factor PgeF [Candidatus Aminicenantes bacterium]|nr:peptidoglycan editing factor PgeF [Candidatus Aminicenantes bacterium]